MYEAAKQLAQRGAALATQAGLDAEGLAVADDLTVAEPSSTGHRVRSWWSVSTPPCTTGDGPPGCRIAAGWIPRKHS